MIYSERRAPQLNPSLLAICRRDPFGSANTVKFTATSQRQSLVTIEFDFVYPISGPYRIARALPSSARRIATVGLILPIIKIQASKRDTKEPAMP